MVIVWRLMAGCVAGHVLEGFDVLGTDKGRCVLTWCRVRDNVLLLNVKKECWLDL